MRQVLLMLFVVLFVFAGASAQELSSEEETLFAQGVSAGMMSKHEGNVVDAFNGLLTLQKLAGTEQYRSLLVTKMNTAFFAMSFVDPRRNNPTRDVENPCKGDLRQHEGIYGAR